MASAYPGAIDAFATRVDSVDYVMASHINDIQNGVVSAQTAIGQEGNSGLCEARLTLTTGVPVTTADVTAATIYLTPYNGNRLALHDGTGWVTHILTQISIAVPNTLATMYDVFCYSNAGTPTLEALVWTNDTTRATALTTLDGVLVKTGATTRRYIGSFRTDDNSSGNVADTVLRRYLWNYNNRVSRNMTRNYIASHTYNVATWRPFNNSAVNAQLAFVVGVAEDAIALMVVTSIIWAAGNSGPYQGGGLNSTTAPALPVTTSSLVGEVYVWSNTTGMVRAGYNFLCPLEFSTAGGTAPTFGQVQPSLLVRG